MKQTWFKPFLVVWLLTLFTLTPAARLQAQTGYPDYQDLYVNDFANILSNSEEQEIRNRLLGLNTTTGVEMTVVTLDSWTAYGSGDPDFQTFAENLFNAWGIGNAETNDGILFIIAMEEREIRLTTGVGLENTLRPDLDDVLDNEVLPLLANGEMGRGMVVGATELADRVLRLKGTSSGPVGSGSTEIDQNAEDLAIVPTPRPATSGSGDTTDPSTNQTSTWIGLLVLLFGGMAGLGGVGGLAWLWTRPLKCPHCQHELRKLGESEDDAFLNAGQQLEEQLNSVNYDVWVCDYDDYVDINRKNKIFSSHSSCPQCSHKTVSSRTQTVRRATQYSTGLKEVTEDCQHCSYHNVKQVTLPRIQKTSSSSSSFGGSSRSSGSSSRSSFGGGRSSGGGSGRSF